MSAETNTPGAGGAASTGAAQAAPSTPSSPEPAPSVAHGEQTASHPAGSARPEGGIPFTERPEALVGGAFAGGLLVALILKRLGR